MTKFELLKKLNMVTFAYVMSDGSFNSAEELYEILQQEMPEEEVAKILKLQEEAFGGD